VIKTVSQVWTLDCWCEEKTSIPLVQIMNEICDTLSTEVWSGGLSSPNPQSILPNSNCSLPDKVIFQFTMNAPQTSLKPPNAVDLAMYLLLSRLPNTGNNQPITSLKPRMSSNTTVTSEKVKICTRRLHLLPIFTWCKRKDLTNILRV